MAVLKYVCLSDLHLGADYSVLTHMDSNGKTSVRAPSTTLTALADALAKFVPALSGAAPPTLILLGDALDLGLSPTGDIAHAFRRFIEAMFPAAGPVFSKNVLCLPGNHDHHLWRTAQDQFFLETLDERIASEGSVIPDLLRTTPLFEQNTARCGLMTQLMRGYPHLQNARVNVAYPNLGLFDAARKRCVILHHGHYIDGVYRAMSALNQGLRGVDGRPTTVSQIVQENGAWVDFLWSGLGEGGDVGRDAVALYETMRSARASHEFSQRLSDGLLAKLADGLGIGPGTDIGHGVTIANVVKGLVDLILLRGAESDRDGYFSVMSPASVADLRWYLEGPVRAQIGQAKIGGYEIGDDKLRDFELSFVFGHTHKPFQDQLTLEGYAKPVSVYNTGGWVMDQPTMAPAQGAAAVFIDDELNLASLRLFNDPLNGARSPVRAAGVGGFHDHDNPLLKRMTEVLETAVQAKAWDAFSIEAGIALELHAGLLLRESIAMEARR